MNPTLTETINELQISELDAMNMLQGNGIISDLCENACDVANADVPAAIKYLKMSRGLLT